MIKQDMLLTSHLDIKKTSFSVPVCKIHWKFLNFINNEEALQFIAMAITYKNTMWLFNQILKPTPLLFIEESQGYPSDKCG